MSIDPEYVAKVAHLLTENERMRATIERIRALHICHDNDRDAQWCASDTMRWPCPTIKALDQP